MARTMKFLIVEPSQFPNLIPPGTLHILMPYLMSISIYDYYCQCRGNWKAVHFFLLISRHTLSSRLMSLGPHWSCCDTEFDFNLIQWEYARILCTIGFRINFNFTFISRLRRPPIKLVQLTRYHEDTGADLKHNIFEKLIFILKLWLLRVSIFLLE